MAPSAVDAVAQATDVAAAAPAQIEKAQFQTLAGKVALITGSGRGIGKGMAIELASRGASVVVVYAKSADAADGVVKQIQSLGCKAIALQADVSKPAEIFKLFDDAVAHFGYVINPLGNREPASLKKVKRCWEIFGTLLLNLDLDRLTFPRKLDIVISNSGTEVWSKEEEVTPEDFDYIFNINCRGQFFVAQQGLKHLTRGGRIILMSSIAAQMAGVPNHALYAGSKAAVEGFTRSFAVDCGEKGITVNAIAPGGVKTDMFDANAWVCFSLLARVAIYCLLRVETDV